MKKDYNEPVTKGFLVEIIGGLEARLVDFLQEGIDDLARLVNKSFTEERAITKKEMDDLRDELRTDISTQTVSLKDELGEIKDKIKTVGVQVNRLEKGVRDAYRSLAGTTSSG